MKPKNRLMTGVKIILFLLLFAFILAAGINAAMLLKARGRILGEADVRDRGADCILVLGAGVRSDGSPSHMLEDRLLVGIGLYEAGAAPKLLMSGDHGSVDYDEVNTMKSFAVEHGVSPDDVFMDHAGFSTYESLIRARDVFGAKHIVIVSQEYHLYRALWLADALGLEAVGVPADLRTYIGQSMREVREIAARCKDFALGFLEPAPTYLGEPIDLTGSGTVTDDKT
ncbi:MAG: YdcF family protein [Clostridiales bacterium]|nr:YdcF family protein [Clostridiales bacterium]